MPGGAIASGKFNNHESDSRRSQSFRATSTCPCGFFSQFQANWWDQVEHRCAGEPGDASGNSISTPATVSRAATSKSVGVVNIGNQDYHIDPLTYFLEQAHTRTFVASLKFNF